MIELRWKKQLSYQEIAAELLTTSEIIQQKLHRARKALRKQMNDWMNEN
ncbi:sigma factor-like helix-turn-helix DNA-binding protein [Paenibacillus aquistagni]|uniref:Sigma-70, region 4 n=1 Tax=Paenibacillus aquistagni TaxID=1852522 RepID=A0A1X7I1D1_9BACL|nr:Sigma-70, region 4 [Paenibacillus aquistagni]